MIFFLKIPTSFVAFLCRPTRSRHYISSDTASRPVCSILDAVVYGLCTVSWIILYRYFWTAFLLAAWQTLPC